MASLIGRRKFLATLLGGAAAWPLAARAQQRTMPVIGFLSSGSPRTFANFLKAFQAGLNEEGFVEARNVAIVYRWAGRAISTNSMRWPPSSLPMVSP